MTPTTPTRPGCLRDSAPSVIRHPSPRAHNAYQARLSPGLLGVLPLRIGGARAHNAYQARLSPGHCECRRGLLVGAPPTTPTRPGCLRD
jgi:hypothetical protein